MQLRAAQVWTYSAWSQLGWFHTPPPVPAQAPVLLDEIATRISILEAQMAAHAKSHWGLHAELSTKLQSTTLAAGADTARECAHIP